MASLGPQFHDIGLLPTLAQLIDEEIDNAKDQLQTIEECHARPGPMVDDDLLERTIRCFSESLGYLDIYDEQLKRWAALKTLTSSEKAEVARLQGLMPSLRSTLAMLVQRAVDYRPKTLEAMMAKSDEELALDFLLRGLSAK